jgi:hypothetical protein
VPITVKPAKPDYADDAKLVQAELVHLPDQVAGALDDAGIRIVACRGSVVDFDPSLSGERPRNWPEGKTWDSVPGAYLPRHKIVAIATVAKTRGERCVPPFGHLHGSRSLAVHETLHGYDYSREHHLSKGRAFRAAWSADRATLASDYYVNAASGPEESFAESGAHQFGLDQSQRSAWPHLEGFWNMHGDGLWSVPLTLDLAPDDDIESLDAGSIGRGVRRDDGSFTLFLTAKGPRGEIGHGMVTVAAGDTGFETLVEVYAQARRRDHQFGMTLHGHAFDVPPFPD